MFRFFVEDKIGNTFKLSKEIIKHIKVARVEKENFICIYKEIFFICQLDNEQAIIIKELNENHEFSKQIIIAAAFIDTKRFEWLIQKAAELGATKLIPVLSQNVSKKIPSDINKKIQRWNQISLNASEQSFRNKQLIVSQPMKFNDVINIKITNKYIAHEKEKSTTEISFPQDSIFLIGPEGGFSEKEVINASVKGYKIISLGKRILRAETASIFIMSRIN